MFKHVYVVETLDAPEGKIEQLRQALVEMVRDSRREEGCFYYDLYRDRDIPHRFCVIMGFKDKKAYDAHTASEHVVSFVKKYDAVVYCNVVENLYERLV